MTGPELRSLFDSIGWTPSAVAKKFAVTERTVYGWYGKAEVPRMLEWACMYVTELALASRRLEGGTI